MSSGIRWRRRFMKRTMNDPVGATKPFPRSAALPAAEGVTGGVTCMSTILLRCLNAVWLVVAASLVSGQTLKDPALRVTEVVAGLNTPTTMAFIGPSDILVL